MWGSSQAYLASPNHCQPGVEIVLIFFFFFNISILISVAYVNIALNTFSHSFPTGASQSPMSIHKASNMNRMRLVYNPACEENTDEVLCHDMVSRASSNSVSSGAANGTRLIDTNTYCKRDRDRCNV